MGFIRDRMKIFDFKGLDLFLVLSKIIIIKKFALNGIYLKWSRVEYVRSKFAKSEINVFIVFMDFITCIKFKACLDFNTPFNF